MTTLLTVDELEQEIKYLRQQNQEILRKLSRIQGENIQFLEQLKHEREKLALVRGVSVLRNHSSDCEIIGQCTCGLRATDRGTIETLS